MNDKKSPNDINDLYDKSDFLAERIIEIEPAIGPKSEFMRGFDWVLAKNKYKAMLEGYNDLVDTILELDDVALKVKVAEDFQNKFGQVLKRHRSA